jgi:hypothetical protein
MSRDYKNHYCLLTDRSESTVVFWATLSCLLTDQLLSFDRPARLRESNIYKSCRWFLGLTNLYNHILTKQAVGNIEELVP